MWRVAVLVDILVGQTVGDDIRSFAMAVEQMTCALRHDMPEVESGDLGYPFKKANPAIREMLHDFDEDWFERHEMYQPPQSPLVAMCDRLDSYLFMLTHAPDLFSNKPWMDLKEDILDQATDLGLFHDVNKLMDEAQKKEWF